MSDTTDRRPPHMSRLWHTRGASDLVAGWLRAMASIPNLRGAACRGSTAWDWDPLELPETREEREARLAAAVGACRSCRVLDACRRYTAAIPPSQRPTGAVAGRVIAPKGKERRGLADHTDPAPNGAQRATQPATAAKEASA
jgi:hypothetical protein